MKDDIKRYLPAVVRRGLSPVAKAFRFAQARIRTQATLARLRNCQGKIFLELGPGSHPIGKPWIGIDYNASAEITWNLTEPLPFASRSINGIYSSHVLEHFTPFDLLKLLHECVRILAADGFFLAAVPNAGLYLRAVGDSLSYRSLLSTVGSNPYCLTATPMDLVNMTAYMHGQHLCMFDEEYLCAMLRNVGFTHVCPRPFLKGYDLEVRDWETLYAFAGFDTFDNIRPAIEMATPRKT